MQQPGSARQSIIQGPEDEAPKLRFNHYQSLPTSDGWYSDEPPIELEEITDVGRYGALEKQPLDPQRHEKQRQRLAAVSLDQPDAPSLFGASATWRYRGYSIGVLGNSTYTIPSAFFARRRRNLLGARPPRAVPRLKRKQTTGNMATMSALRGVRSSDPSAQTICLFNVVVALEWVPNRRQLNQLEWAFRRASDFLYDVTDGNMAFGQVVFGGPELLEVCDIQIAASNRLLPRSWVDGLNLPKKYMPIRIGRGMWDKDRRITIPWEEPEGYRTIVHEWGHYALGLKDLYLDEVAQEHGNNLIVPSISLPIESIMSTVAGTSELAPKRSSPSLRSRVGAPSDYDERTRIVGRFPFLRFGEQDDGPGQLPLPLPQCCRLAPLPNDELDVVTEPANATVRSNGRQILPDSSETAEYEYRLVSANISRYLQLDHCWVYLLKRPGRAGHPPLIAQGTLDWSAKQDVATPDDIAVKEVKDGSLLCLRDARDRLERGTFTLLGAEEGDTVLLIGEQDDDTRALLVKRFTVPAGGLLMAKDVEDVSPGYAPHVDVLPSALDPKANGFASVQVRVSADPDGLATLTELQVVPLGALEDGVTTISGKAVGNKQAAVRNLDGHVIIRWTKDGAEKLLVCAYSQGGSPGESGFPVPPNPISAGSSEGNALLFFSAEPNTADAYESVRIVTTRIQGGDPAGYPEDKKPRSYTYSVASNHAFDAPNAPLDALSPTIVMFYDRAPSRREDGSTVQTFDHAIYIYDETNSAWQKLASYAPAEMPYVAAAIDTASITSALGRRPAALRFRLFASERMV